MSEMTQYVDEELQVVERIVGTLNKQAKEGRCDGQMLGTIRHLVEEMLFLRAVMYKHPPYKVNL